MSHYTIIGGGWTSLGGGIQAKRFIPQVDVSAGLKNLKEEILRLIKDGHENQAFELLCECPVSERRKQCFCKKFFPSWQK